MNTPQQQALSTSETPVTLRWKDYRGLERSRSINQIIDVRDFIGTPGYPMLVVAANTRHSISMIERFLDEQAWEIPRVARSRSWIQRRRWLFQQPGTDNSKGSRPDVDGQQARAVAIMAQHPSASLYALVGELKKHGIKRSREWVRLHRCDAPTT